MSWAERGFWTVTRRSGIGSNSSSEGGQGTGKRGTSCLLKSLKQGSFGKQGKEEIATEGGAGGEGAGFESSYSNQLNRKQA